MKDDLVEMEHEFPLVHMHSVQENWTTFLDVTLKKIDWSQKGLISLIAHLSKWLQQYNRMESLGNDDVSIVRARK